MKKLIVAVAALALMAGSAYAADWEFYGKAYLWTGWSDIDLVDQDEPDSAYYDVQYGENLYSSALIGANVKVSDELSGRFEYGTSGGVANIRHLYGEWDFGAGVLTVGKTDTPLNVAYSSQQVPDDVTNENGSDLGLGGYGDFDNSRHPELMLTFGDFSIALISPRDGDADVEYDQAVIPMIAACYKVGFDMGEVQIAGGYVTGEINDEDVDAFGMGFGANLNFGAFGMFATFIWAENAAYLGAPTATTTLGGEGIMIGNDYDDCESLGGTIGVTFAINEMLTLEAGYGYIHDELDDADVTDIAQSYYLQAAITLAPGVTVTPEVGMLDQRETGNEEILYFGAAWVIAF